MAKILIPTALRPLTNDHRQVTVDAETVSQALKALAHQCVDVKDEIFDAQGQLVTHLNVFVGDRNIRDLSGLETAVESGDEILLVPAIAGG